MRWFLATAITAVLAAIPAAASCEGLMSSPAFKDATVTKAEKVAAGEFTQPGGRGAKGANVYKTLSAFCRVEATLKPSADSDIKIEVWLPASGWNGNYQAVGNGGWAGTVSYAAMADALREGYAASSTDTGHTGGSGSFALGHPEKLIDFGWRSEHEMVVKSKALIQAFYGHAAKYSYWNGCSTGGRQGLKEAQRFPGDFDGIIAGAQANPRTGLALEGLWVASAVHKDAASFIPAAKFPVIHKAVMNECDALDGVKDGLIADPRKCRFDPKSIQCAGADGPDCLTTAQAESARKIYTPLSNSRTGKQIMPPLERGSELGWNVMAGPDANAVNVDQFRYVVFKDPNWDWHTVNFDADSERALKVDNGTIDATDPDIRKFLAHGKLLMYHGWADPNVPPETSINYYSSASEKSGGAAKAAGAMRLFMVPGMGHCGGGEGPNTFDMVSAISAWVEQGKAPEQITASHSTAGKVDRTRPLCPYPQTAKYKGSGSIDDAANFSCSAN